jgi:hypothetical protein
MSEARALEVITATLEEVKPAMRVIVVRFRK